MHPAIRIVIGALCLAGAFLFARFAISVAADWSATTFLAWSLVFLFLAGAYAAFFYPWHVDESAAPIALVTLSASDHSGLIEIGRDNRFLAMTRKCAVLVDGEKVGELCVGQRIQVRVDVGAHTVQARLSWVASAPYSVNVRPNETTRANFALPSLAELDRAIAGPFDGSLYFQWRAMK